MKSGHRVCELNVITCSLHVSSSNSVSATEQATMNIILIYWVLFYQPSNRLILHFPTFHNSNIYVWLGCSSCLINLTTILEFQPREQSAIVEFLSVFIILILRPFIWVSDPSLLTHAFPLNSTTLLLSQVRTPLAWRFHDSQLELWPQTCLLLYRYPPALEQKLLQTTLTPIYQYRPAPKQSEGQLALLLCHHVGINPFSSIGAQQHRKDRNSEFNVQERSTDA